MTISYSGCLRISRLQDNSPCGFIYLALGSNEGPGKASQDCVLQLCSEELLLFVANLASIVRFRLSHRPRLYTEALWKDISTSFWSCLDSFLAWEGAKQSRRRHQAPCDLAVQLHMIFQCLCASKQLSGDRVGESRWGPLPSSREACVRSLPCHGNSMQHVPTFDGSRNRDTARERGRGRKSR